ncbi:MAG: hypothetical protein CMJ94_00385 [Planctomycetes bacterium]|nr:hypothetical protein [Planctomycetota bacterium]
MTERARSGIRPSSWILAISVVLLVVPISLIVLKFTHRSPQTQTALFGVVELPSADQKLLRRARYFSGGTIGYANAVSAEQRAWARIRDEPDAAEQFRSLAESSNPAAVLWGIAGLYRIDPPAYRKARDHYRDDERSVVLWSGCVKYSVQLGRWLENGRDAFAQDLHQLMDDPPPNPFDHRASEREF